MPPKPNSSSNSRTLHVERLTPLLFQNLPSIVIYCLCFGYFLINLLLLLNLFLEFDTTVYIRFETNARIKFPALTVCGCSAENVISPLSQDDTIEAELSYYADRSIADILEKVSFTERGLIRSCYYVYDSRKPQYRTPCGELEQMVQSMQGGRKCISYLSVLHEGGHAATQEEIEHDYDIDTLGNVSFIQLEINFDEAMGMPLELLTNAAMESQVMMGMHAPEDLPTTLDTEFWRLEPNKKYEVHFWKRIRRQLPAPYATNCKHYDEWISKYTLVDSFLGRGQLGPSCFDLKCQIQDICLSIQMAVAIALRG